MKGKKLAILANKIVIKIKHTGKDDRALKEARRFLLQKLTSRNGRDGVGC